MTEDRVGVFPLYVVVALALAEVLSIRLFTNKTERLRKGVAHESNFPKTIC